MQSNAPTMPIQVRPFYRGEPFFQRANVNDAVRAKNGTKKSKNRPMLTANNPGKKKETDNNKKNGFFYIFFKETNLHGFKYFVATGRPKAERAYWLVAILATYTLLFISLWNQLRDYTKRPILVSFEPEPTVISTLPLPALTLCPDMQVRKSYFNLSDAIDNTNLTRKEAELLGLSTTFCDLALRNQQMALNILPETVKEFSKAHTSYENCLDFVVSVELAFSQIEDPCIYFRPSFSQNGACLTFNMVPIRQLLKSVNNAERLQRKYSKPALYQQYGRWTTRYYFWIPRYYSEDENTKLGREVVWSPDTGYHPPNKKQIRPRPDGNPPLAASNNAVSAGYQLYLQIPSVLFDPSCFSGKGFHVYVHNPAEVPSIKHSYFYVMPAQELDIKIEPKVYVMSDQLLQWPPKTRKCFMQHEHPLAYFTYYSQLNCQMECEANFTLERCNCTTFDHPRTMSTPVCGPHVWACLAENVDTANFSCECLPACSEIKYETTYAALNKNWTDYHITKKNLSFEGGLFMSLKLAYRSKYLQAIRRKPAKSFNDLVADVGGLLSLFTGFSFLSFVEIAYFLFMKKS